MQHRFVYEMINDKVIQRKILILETLNNGEDFVSSQHMAELLHCTVRTIAKDISELKRELPENWSILGFPTKGYVLHKPLQDSLYSIIGNYLSQSVIYKIMIGIFNNRYYTLEKWSHVLYINKRTLKNKLKVYAHTLKQSNIDLKYGELELYGDEINIRYYYCVFFYITGKYINHSKLPILLKEKLWSLFKSYSLKIDYDGAFTIFSVFISRFFNKKHITKKMDIPSFSDEYIQFFNEVISIIEGFYKIHLNDNEKNTLMFFLFFVIKTEHSNLIIDYPNIFYQNHKQLIHLLTINNCFHTQVEKQLFIDLLPYLFKIRLYNLNFFSIKYIFEPLQHSQSILLEGYNKNLHLTSYWNNNSCNGIFNNYEIEFISTHATIIINSTLKKHVLFLYSGNAAVEKILYSKLKKGLSNNV
ncbi:helix-turn-helix domain containing protein, partial [Bacillus cereus]|uniref:helix-turn-helix domain-containing protein n=1 Tax=Bacillus cereus TaxID=1396 RepID=UPI0005CF3DDF